MSDEHLTVETFRRFASRLASRQEAGDAVRKLASGCPDCREIAAAAWQPTASEPDGLELSTAALDRILRQVYDHGARLGAERGGAPALHAELRAHPQPRRLTMIRNLQRFRTYGLAELLIRESYAHRFANAEEGVLLAELAVTVATELDELAYPSVLVADLRGRALAHLGNARRVASDLSGAEAALRDARRALWEGSGDPLEHAQWCLFLSYLRRGQGNFAQAIRYNKRATVVYARLGDEHLVGYNLNELAYIYMRMGDYRLASETLGESLKRLDPVRDPIQALFARGNLGDCLANLDQLPAARTALAGLAAAFAARGEALTALRVRWMEGNLEVKAGNLRAAEAAYLEVRQGFARAEIAYDQALVSLDLAALYSEQGRTAEVKTLTAEMVSVFQALQIHREALAALILFQRSLDTEAATVALVQEVAAYLRGARENPTLRFRH